MVKARQFEIREGINIIKLVNDKGLELCRVRAEYDPEIKTLILKPDSINPRRLYALGVG